IRTTAAGRPPSSLQKVLPTRLFFTAGRTGGIQARAAPKTAPPASSPRTENTTRTKRRRARNAANAPAAPKTISPAPPSTQGVGGPKRSGAVVSSATAKVGTRSDGSRFRKSKISCPPGSRPVEKVAQETGVCAGTVGRRGEYPPRALSAARLGKRP